MLQIESVIIFCLAMAKDQFSLFGCRVCEGSDE